MNTLKPCPFCEALQTNKDIRVSFNQQLKADNMPIIYEDYTVALVIRSYTKGNKSTAGRTTDYKNRGIGYKLNYCPECGRQLKRNKEGGAV